MKMKIKIKDENKRIITNLKTRSKLDQIHKIKNNLPLFLGGRK